MRKPPPAKIPIHPVKPKDYWAEVARQQKRARIDKEWGNLLASAKGLIRAAT